MTLFDISDLRKIVDSAISLIVAGGSAEPVDLAVLGQVIKQVDPEFSTQKYGSEKLKHLLERMPSLNIIKDESIFPPRYLAQRRAIDDDDLDLLAPSSPINKVYTKNNINKLRDFSYIPEKLYAELARMALPEPWSYPSNEQDDRYLLLRNYLDFTYVRLEYEGKILYSENQKFAALNTGLVDRRYEPIYAIFIKNPNEGRQQWKLQDFCILGENYFGKMLVRHFSKYPEAAYYFDDPHDAFYDIRKGQPKVDWEHVILENPERIPSGLIERVLPNFKAQSTRKYNSNGQEYSDSLRSAIEHDTMAYRLIMQTYKEALEVAIKKISWNHRTAIPVYFTRFHRMSLLLPLAICSDDTVDVALVVERTDSGNYQGHTAFPLDWAYSHARLVCRPDSDWLSVDKITPSENFLAVNTEPSDELPEFS